MKIYVLNQFFCLEKFYPFTSWTSLSWGVRRRSCGTGWTCWSPSPGSWWRSRPSRGRPSWSPRWPRSGSTTTGRSRSQTLSQVQWPYAFKYSGLNQNEFEFLLKLTVHNSYSLLNCYVLGPNRGNTRTGSNLISNRESSEESDE